MEKIKALIKKYYEGLSYLFFGGVATLLNLVLFALFQAVFGTEFATGAGNVLDNAICILFAYWTNRTVGSGDYLAGRYHFGAPCGVRCGQR